METEQQPVQTPDDLLSAEINELAARIVSFQRALGLSNDSFASKYREYVGSARAWGRLKDGTFLDGKCDLKKTLEKLRQMSYQLDAARNFNPKHFTEKLPFVVSLNTHYSELLSSTTDQRCLVALAPQGCGKSWWASSRLDIAHRSPGEAGRTFYQRISFKNRDKSLHLCNALIRMFGGETKKSPADAVCEVLRCLRLMPDPIIILDEAHYGGIELMSLIKECIDETDARFVYLGFPTEYERVRMASGSAMMEARQFQRRCLQPICDEWRVGVSEDDVEMFLRSKGFIKERELPGFADAITPVLIQHYNLTTLNTAIKQATKMADDDDVPVTLEMVRKELTALTSTPQERRAARSEARRKRNEGKN